MQDTDKLYSESIVARGYQGRWSRAFQTARQAATLGRRGCAAWRFHAELLAHAVDHTFGTGAAIDNARRSDLARVARAAVDLVEGRAVPTELARALRRAGLVARVRGDA